MSTGAELKQIWKSHNIKLSTKLRLMKALVWPHMGVKAGPSRNEMKKESKQLR